MPDILDLHNLDTLRSLASFCQNTGASLNEAYTILTHCGKKALLEAKDWSIKEVEAVAKIAKNVSEQHQSTPHESIDSAMVWKDIKETRKLLGTQYFTQLRGDFSPLDQDCAFSDSSPSYDCQVIATAVCRDHEIRERWMKSEKSHCYASIGVLPILKGVAEISPNSRIGKIAKEAHTDFRSYVTNSQKPNAIKRGITKLFHALLSSFGNKSSQYKKAISDNVDSLIEGLAKLRTNVDQGERDLTPHQVGELDTKIRHTLSDTLKEVRDLNESQQDIGFVR